MNEIVEEKRVHPLAQFRKDIKAALPTFGLSSEREQERMSSVLMVAIEKDPELLWADRQSLIAAVRQCANHGLVPDGNEATLQVYNSKVKVNGQDQWIKKVQYQPMVRGIINRILRSGKVDTVWAEVVYKGEEFRIDISHGDRRPKHDPDFFNRGGDIVGVYAVAKLANGSIDCEPMRKDQIDRVRNVAKTKNVWDNWFEEKAKVAVLRRLSKRLPLSAEDMDMIMNREEHDLDAPKDVTPSQMPEEGRQNLAKAIAAQKEEKAAPEPAEDAGDTIDGEAREAPTIQDVIHGNPEHEFEYAEGRTAQGSGIRYEDCPYEDDKDPRRGLWKAGWLAGEREDEV